MINSPFLVIEDALSPSRCEQLIEQFGVAGPTLDPDGRPLKHERIMSEQPFMGDIGLVIGDNMQALEDRYSARIRGVDAPIFQQYFENPDKPCEPHGCASSKYLRKRWVKLADVDLTAYLWLKDYHDSVPLDPRFEVYGGKLEFPAFNFSLLPQRGSMVIFPATPHFITAISPVLVGSYEHLRIPIRLTNKEGLPWFYDPARFPGTYQEWFLPDGQ